MAESLNGDYKTYTVTFFNPHISLSLEFSFFFFSLYEDDFEPEDDLDKDGGGLKLQDAPGGNRPKNRPSSVEDGNAADLDLDDDLYDFSR